VETRDQERTYRDRVVTPPVCWCGIGPPGPTGTLFFGAILVIGGGIWFLFNLGLITVSILDLIGPLFLIGVGLSYLGWAVYAREQGG
jgi:hypothetical protein